MADKVKVNVTGRVEGSNGVYQLGIHLFDSKDAALIVKSDAGHYVKEVEAAEASKAEAKEPHEDEKTSESTSAKKTKPGKSSSKK